MDSKQEKQMARMVDAVQPHCDEEIRAAMTCSHAGSMSSVLMSKLLGGAGAISKAFDLPNPVFIAAGKDHIYAFKYKPWFLKFKIKKEVARWAKNEVDVTSEETKTMYYFALTFSSGESLPFEIPVMFGGRELVHTFLEALKK